MNVVIDTNVFVSSFFGGNPRKIIDLWKEEKITLCVTKDVLDEYMGVLRRTGLSHEALLRKLLSLFATGFNLRYTAKTPSIRIVRDDPEDDKFIECAVALEAEIIITGDRALRTIGEYRGVRIMTPLVFLKYYGSGR